MIMEEVNGERFRDLAPGEIYAILLDEGRYLCSERTMYNILKKNQQTVVRRQSTPHVYKKPELLATRPNELWSWDITKLRGPSRWMYYFLYVLMDVYSRYVVGWMLAHEETGKLAEALIADTYLKQNIVPGSLTIHADNGAPMRSLLVAELMSNLGVSKTHSRPHVSNDNPFSESLFKTVKYDPEYPDRFSSIEHGREFSDPFFKWYNFEHRHSGIAMLTPAMVHLGKAPAIIAQRNIVLAQAFERHPERFVKGQPKAEKLPEAVWINPPPPAIVVCGG
jgi:putative transposase